VYTTIDASSAATASHARPSPRHHASAAQTAPRSRGRPASRARAREAGAEVAERDVHRREEPRGLLDQRNVEHGAGEEGGAERGEEPGDMGKRHRG
jgi:hypothetical protein